MLRNLFKQEFFRSAIQQAIGTNIYAHKLSLYDFAKAFQIEVENDLPYAKLWDRIMASSDLDDLLLISSILTDSKILVNSLQLLDARMEATGIVDPEDALCHSLNIMEKQGDHFEDKHVIEDEMGMADFMEHVHNSRPVYDAGVSFLHGIQTHRIQLDLVRNVLGNERTSDIFHRLAKPEYHRPNEGYGAFDKREYLTFWDDVMDRTTTFKVHNHGDQSLREMLQEIKENKAELNEVPDYYYPCLDSRNPEWLTALITSCEDPDITFLRNAILNERERRMDEVHKDVYFTGLEPEFFGLESETAATK